MRPCSQSIPITFSYSLLLFLPFLCFDFHSEKPSIHKRDELEQKAPHVISPLPHFPKGTAQRQDKLACLVKSVLARRRLEDEFIWSNVSTHCPPREEDRSLASLQPCFPRASGQPDTKLTCPHNSGFRGISGCKTIGK